MKKTLIVSTVAAATLVSGAAFASGLAENTKISGSIDLVYAAKDNGDNWDDSFEDNESTIKIQHKSDLSQNLKGFGKAEFHFAADDNDLVDDDDTAKGIYEIDEAYFGVKGAFGKVWVGKDDSAYEKLKVVDFDEYLGVSDDIAKVNEDNTLNYTSAKIGGLSATVTYQLESQENHDAAINVIYKMDNISLIAAYAMADDDAGEDSIGVAIEAGLGDLTLGATFQTEDKDRDLIAGSAVYAMGANQFALGVSMEDYDVKDKKVLKVAGQALHNLSDDFFVYFEARLTDDDSKDDAIAEVALGGSYGF